MKKPKILLIAAIVLLVLQIIILTGAATFQLAQVTGRMNYIAGFLTAMLDFLQYEMLIIPSVICFIFYFKAKKKESDESEKADSTEDLCDTTEPICLDEIVANQSKQNHLDEAIENIPIELIAPPLEEAKNSKEESLEKQYQKAIVLMNLNSQEDIDSAAKIFVKLKDYKETTACLEFCKYKTAKTNQKTKQKTKQK